MVYLALFSKNNDTIFGKKDPYVINSFQSKALVEVHELYSLFLAEKKYEKISTYYEKYISLMSILLSINTKDPKISLLLRIVEDTLTGSINAISLYSHFTYNEIMILKLNKQIDDILSNKNVLKAMNGATGLITMTKTFKMSPLLSNYIYLYGMPAYGEGFDPIKLSFLKNISTNYNNKI
jgi:predicted DNA-binding protein YlxM (UPF0122 family)